MSWLHHAAVWLVVGLLHFFSPNAALNVVAPRDGIALTTAIAYGTGPRRTLDVYAPEPSGGGSAPVVVFFYGGGWESGTKEMYRFVGAALAARGVVVVIPDTRLHPEVRFPTFVDDAAAAVAWVRQNATRFGGDPHRLFLMGHSAGGHVAALLALDASYLRAAGMSPDDVCGVIGLAGAYDFAPRQAAEFAAIFGPEAEWPRSRPINHATASAPPMLLLVGGSDSTVEPGNTLRMVARLRAVGASATDVVYPGIGHTALIAAMSGTLEFLAAVRAETLRFIAEHGACGGARMQAAPTGGAVAPAG
jgi:acetyl esterase/lipase